MQDGLRSASSPTAAPGGIVDDPEYRADRGSGWSGSIPWPPERWSGRATRSSAPAPRRDVWLLSTTLVHASASSNPRSRGRRRHAALRAGGGGGCRRPCSARRSWILGPWPSCVRGFQVHSDPGEVRVGVEGRVLQPELPIPGDQDVLWGALRPPRTSAPGRKLMPSRFWAWRNAVDHVGLILDQAAHAEAAGQGSCS